MSDSSQTRTRGDTRAVIVEATARLLREHGPAAVTTRAVAERAGVQAPTIYRLFGDKDGLLDAVAEQVMATYVSAKTAAVAVASAEQVDALEDLRGGWATQIDFGLANPTLFALLVDPGRGWDSPAAQSGRQVLEARVHRLAVAGRLRVAERRAVELIHAAGTGAVLSILSMPPGQRDPGVADDMFAAVIDQICTDVPDRADSGSLGTAVALRALAPRLGMLSENERHLLVEWLDRAIDGLQRDH